MTNGTVVRLYRPAVLGRSAPVDDSLGLVERLQQIVSSGWGAFALSLLVIAYLFRELRKADAARLADIQADKAALSAQHKVTERVVDVLERLDSTIQPPPRRRP